MKKLLLTAFEPFAGKAVNSSLEVAKVIKAMKFAGVQIKVATLPVSRFQAIKIAFHYIFEQKPDVIIMLGEADNRLHFTPERVAINIDDFEIPDNTGHQPKGEPIIKGGPASYFSTLPINEIVRKLGKENIPAKISNSAGTYLCNRLFYNIMHFIATEGLPIRAGFIHLPHVHKQTLSKHRGFTSMSLEDVVKAVRITINASMCSSLELSLDPF